MLQHGDISACLVTKAVVVMVAMEDVTEEEEVVDKVTKMAAELIFSVDAHISLMHTAQWRQASRV